MPKFTQDPDAQKGATEDGLTVPVSLRGQLSHRSTNTQIKESDTDFPEPGCSPEHSGQNRTGKHRHSAAGAKKRMRGA